MPIKVCPQCGRKFKRTPSYFAKYPNAVCDQRCYSALRTGVPLVDHEKVFWEKVEKSDGCWIWKGCINSSGRGTLSVLADHWLASRYAWFLTNGPIPQGKLVCHHCDNGLCVRPSHLFLGTTKTNREDAARKKRLRYTPQKLTRGMAELIRQIYKGGDWTYPMLAVQFNVSKTHISSIIRGRYWK